MQLPLIKKNQTQDIREKVRNITKLSTLPLIATRVLELVDNPKTSASTLGKIISSDQVLTARILKLANSAYYGFPREISTLHLAIVVLGFNALRDLVLSISVIDQFHFKKNGKINPEKFWRHALIVGMGARCLSPFMGYSVAGEVFVAGLLHDVGYLILFQHFPDLFDAILVTSREQNLAYLEAERQVMGFTHADLGSWLAEGWNLPDKLVQAIRHHHEPQKNSQYPELTGIIHLADLISYSIDEGSGLNPPERIDASQLENKLKEVTRSVHTLSFFQKKFRAESKKVDNFLNLLTKIPSGSQNC